MLRLPTAAFACLVLCCGMNARSAPLDDLRVAPPLAPEPQPESRPNEPPAKSVSEVIVETLTGESAVPSVTPSVSQSADGEPRAAVEAFSKGDIDGCLSHLRSAVAEQPNLPPPKLILAGFYLKTGQRAAARSILEELYAFTSKHPQLYLSLADMALAEGRLADAEAHVRLLEQQGVPSNWNDEEQQWLHTAIASYHVTIAERRRNWRGANEWLARWVEHAPDKPALRHRWGTALFHDRRYEEAYEQFDIAYRQAPNLGLPEVAMAALYAGQRQFADAHKWYAGALKKHPNDPSIHFAWAMALLYDNRAGDAQQHLNQAKRLGADSADLNALYGIAARMQEAYAEAEQHLRQALKRNPHHDEARYQLVMSLLEQDVPAKTAEALKQAQNFAADSPNSSLLQACLGAAWAATGEHEKAEWHLRVAAASPATQSETVYLLGRALAANEKPADARRVAAYLRDNYMNRPGIFVLRPAAIAWIEGAED